MIAPHIREDPVIVQDSGYAVGNFIECTPAIQAISKVIGKPVRVYFQSPHVQDMYLDCPFIDIMKAPPIGYISRERSGTEVLFQSSDVNRYMPDHEFLYKTFACQIYGYEGAMPHSYVDPVEPPADREFPDGTLVGIVRGARSERWHDAKDPGNYIYRMIIDLMTMCTPTTVFPYLIGNEDDYKWWMNDMKTWNPRITGCQSNLIRHALGMLNAMDCVIANDSGLYHAAVALRKPTFVMWKNTDPIKNRAPGGYATHSIGKDNWMRDFGEWYEAYKKWAPAFMSIKGEIHASPDTRSAN